MTMTAGRPRNKTEEDITNEVVQRFERTCDPRLREILRSLITHLHAVVREVELTEAEWLQAIEFLTATGHMCTGNRQEFILLSDSLGVSILVDLIAHRKPAGATESTVIGPFFRDGARELPSGGNMAEADPDGEPVIICGSVTGLDGATIANAVLDVWQTSSKGVYDSQMGNGDELHMRAKYRTDQDGRYLVRTTRPNHYSAPTDGPVGRMIVKTTGHPWRPPHVHFVVSAPGYETLVTHIFDSESQYLDADIAFAVKESLIADFVLRTEQDETAHRLGVQPPYRSVHYDFVLKQIG
jgi:protocatechuate 3,4-dioxygenase beta subunit